MIIVAVDPGDSTGIVVYDSFDDNLISSFTLTLSVPGEDDIFTWVKRYDPELILLELLPENKSDCSMELLNAYASFQRNCHREGLPLVPVYPGHWKPFAYARNWKFVKAGSVHETDAFNMMRHWFYTVAKKDVKAEYV